MREVEWHDTQISIMRFVLKSLSDAIKFIFREGSWTLLPHEQRVLDAALESLESETQEAVRKQLSVPCFIERMNNGRVNVFRFYRPVDSLCLRDGAYDDLLVRVSISVNGRPMMAHATFYRGLIFSVEFKKPRSFFVDREVSVISVTRGSPSNSFTRVIDRAEHGK